MAAIPNAVISLAFWSAVVLHRYSMQQINQTRLSTFLRPWRDLLLIVIRDPALKNAGPLSRSTDANHVINLRLGHSQRAWDLNTDIQNELCDSGRCIEPHAGRLELHAFASARTWIESDSDTAAFRLQDQFSHLESVG